MPLTRLAMVDESAALALAGANVQLYTAGGAKVALGAAATVIVSGAQDELAVSGVWDEREFRLYGPAPAAIVSRLTGPLPFTPTEPEHGLPIHVFVRLDGGCVYVGVVQPGGCEWTEDELVQCELWIEPPLSSEVLERVRPRSEPPALPGLDWLQYVNADRVRAVELFVTGWYPATEAHRPASEVSVPVPHALAEFYRLACERPAILGCQNRILPQPEQSAGSDGERTVIGVENQGGFHWSVLWSADFVESDPAVWVTVDGRSEPHTEHESLSGFLLQFSLHEAAMSAPYWATIDRMSRSLVAELRSMLRPVPLKPFLSPVSPIDFLVAPGLVAHIHDRGNDEVSVWISAIHRSALTPLGELDLPWRSFAG
ncbi:hypothetical protein ABZT26_23750 [Streptomyces sp. NPDC005395]|uniref:hypothetical protein n=1 Tax=Streptomyces sp. NPDC005395 TaxID=3157042 RepID=UPI0033A0316A